jgi:acyl-CoA reductase-like NAD-dependent aldehyde dehydrogenase
MSPTPSAAVTPTSRPALDDAVAVVSGQRRTFARMAPAEKAVLLRSTLPILGEVAAAWVEAGCRAKRLPLGKPLGGEEWLAGPLPTGRNIRLLAESLETIAKKGQPALGRGVRTGADERVEVDVFPTSGWDGNLYRGMECSVLLLPGVDEQTARDKQAGFYKQRDPEGKLSLILGAGNVSSIPIMDVLAKMFVEGHVCVLKMNPINEWVGPFIERTLEPMIKRGFVRVVYGGGDVGEYLCQHPGVEDVHITGSDKTHDRIIWGPPGPEQERRKREHNPLLKKPITSELGNVSPVAVVPGEYTEAELAFQARNVVTMVTNNASFNCNAAKMLITARGWPQRDRFLELVRQGLRAAAPRHAYYPGARDRFTALTAGRTVESFGDSSDNVLPWVLITQVDSSRADDPLFSTEPFCSILSHTEVGDRDPEAFLATATTFCNYRLWGTLNAAIIIDPRTEKGVASALDRAILDLRYGTVAINLWPAVAYGTISPPWGGHPSATLENIQSGLGWVHNSYFLDGVEKSVMRGSITLWPTPSWFFDNKAAHVVGEKITRFEIAPSALKVPGLTAAALRG